MSPRISLRLELSSRSQPLSFSFSLSFILFFLSFSISVSVSFSFTFSFSLSLSLSFARAWARSSCCHNASNIFCGGRTQGIQDWALFLVRKKWWELFGLFVTRGEEFSHAHRLSARCLCMVYHTSLLNSREGKRNNILQLFSMRTWSDKVEDSAGALTRVVNFLKKTKECPLGILICFFIFFLI